MAAALTSTGEPVLPLRLGPPLAKEDDDENAPPDWLHLKNCSEKKCLEDFYEICDEAKWKNGRPVWFDGQNHIYMTKTKSWAAAVDEDGIHNDRGWLYDSAGGGDKKYPHQARSWHVYDGKNWNPCKARVDQSSPPFVNVVCDERPDLNGCYLLVSADEAEYPVWGHGMKRLYKDDVANRWAICLNPASIEEKGGVLCSSTEEPPRDRPDDVIEWVYYDGSEWTEASADVWKCTRPPPVQLQVTCPEKKELNGTYKLWKDGREQINDKPAWNDGDNFIYFTSNKAWAVCIGKSSTENDRGWLYAKSRESKMPDKVTEWHAYDGKDWNESKGSSVIVPEGDRRKAFSSPVFGDRPAGKPKKAAAKAKPKAKAAAPAKVEKEKRDKPTAAKKKGLGRMGGDEMELGKARRAGEARDTAAVSILPNTRWLEIKPTRCCLDEIRSMAEVLPRSEDIADDVEMKVEELKFSSKDKVAEYGLEDDDLAALAAYTHDLQNPDGSCTGNFYFEMNKALRQRGQDERKGMMERWGFVVHYIIKAMSLLPDWQGVCFRGFAGKDEVIKEYEIGRPIQWGAFTSVTTVWDAAAGFCDPEDGVIFKIQVTNGRQICDFSFFPAEDEILLTPAHRFIVSSAPYERDGFTCLDLVQQKNKVFVS